MPPESTNVPAEPISQEILDGIQRIRGEWSFGNQPDYGDYLGTGVTAYQFWLEMRLARLADITESRDRWVQRANELEQRVRGLEMGAERKEPLSAANELALGMHQERNRW